MISAGRGIVLVGKIYRRDFFHLVRKSWGYSIHVAKKKWAELCPPTQKWAGRGGGGSFGRDFVRLPIRI